MASVFDAPVASASVPSIFDAPAEAAVASAPTVDALGLNSDNIFDEPDMTVKDKAPSADPWENAASAATPAAAPALDLGAMFTTPPASAPAPAPAPVR